MSSKLEKNNDVSKETISQAVKEYCQSKNLSQEKLAAKCKVSGAVINHILNGKWESISESTWKKVWNVVSEGKKALLFSTNDHESVVNACKVARSQKLMIGLIGDTGMGKTTSLKTISRLKNTFYVSFDKTMKARQFFSDILKEMGIALEGNIYDMVNRIADELNNNYENPLLIIDEAGKITHNVMLYLHSLRDKTSRNCGIILAGMPYFKTNLLKNSNKQKEGFAEFLRRINIWHELKGLSRNEIKAICIESGITDENEIREFNSFKRFGDLTNHILLHQIEQITSLIND